MSEFDVGREPIQIIEIDQPLCSLSYGASPCTAAIGVTGDRKCFNTSKTCQDKPNYSPETLTLRFCRSQDKLPGDVFVIPSVTSASTAPTEINVVGGSKSKGPLGVRANLKVTFQDHPYSDNLVDKYRTERDYIATDRGTFWNKWLARNPYYSNYRVRVKDGYVGQPLADMQTRTYLIDSISGPDSNGKVTLSAKDVLKLADNDRAQAPAASPGELIVDYGEADSMSTLRITNASVEDYPGGGIVRINKEIFSYLTSVQVSDTEVNLQSVLRSEYGTEPQSHDAGDRVQLCLRYTEARPDNIAFDLLTKYGAVPAEFIPRADWTAESEVWLEQFRLSTLITEPTGVDKLLGEITEQALFYIWWDERAQQIRLKALRPAYTDPVVPLNDTNHVIAGSIELKAEPRERISQVWVFFGQRNPVEKLDDDQNYRRVRIRADLDAESDLQYGEQRIKKVYSRWIQTDAVAIQTTVRLLARFRDTPEYLGFRLDAKDRALWTGDLADVVLDNVVDDTGAPITKRWQVITAEEAVPGEVVEYKLQFFEYSAEGQGGRFAFWLENSAPDYLSATDAQREEGVWWSDASDKMPNGDDPYFWQ